MQWPEVGIYFQRLLKCRDRFVILAGVQKSSGVLQAVDTEDGVKLACAGGLRKCFVMTALQRKHFSIQRRSKRIVGKQLDGQFEFALGARAVPIVATEGHAKRGMRATRARIE